MSAHLKARITTKGPKKILALDGDGISRMTTIEVSADIERLVSCGAVIAPHERWITLLGRTRRPGL